MSTTRRGYLIGAAAELAHMHPQTLRMYERRGLVCPRRTAGNTRIYSDADIRLLQRIQQLSDEGLNLLGIERILQLEQRLERAERRIGDLRQELKDTVDEHRRAVVQLRAGRGEIVPVRPRSTALVPRSGRVVVTMRVRGAADGDR